MTIPAPLKGVKFKTPPIESEELDRFYDIVFAPDSFFATWAGRVGHYMYGKEPHQIASNQDGYVYLWFSDYNAWTMSADSRLAKAFCREYVEINI